MYIFRSHKLKAEKGISSSDHEMIKELGVQGKVGTIDMHIKSGIIIFGLYLQEQKERRCRTNKKNSKKRN